MNDSTIRTHGFRSLTASALIAGCALSSTVAFGASSQVIGQLAAEGDVIIGEGIDALDISNDVTPYFEGDLISTADGSEAVIRFARSSSHFRTLPLTDAVGRRSASGEFLVDASGTGVRFSFPTDADFTVKFDCMTIRNGAATDTSSGTSNVSGTVVTADGQVHVHSGNGRLIVSTDEQTEYLVKQDQSVSSCTGTQVAAAGGVRSATQDTAATTTGFESTATASGSDVVINQTSKSTSLKRAAGTSAAMLGAAAVSISSGGTSVTRNSNTAAASAKVAGQQPRNVQANSSNANASNDGRVAKAVKVSRNNNAAASDELASDASFTGGHRHGSKHKKHGKRNHGGCFGGAASPVAGGKHNKCKRNGGKHRHW